MDWSTALITWIASILGTTGLGWVFREWIAARLTHAIKYEYDVELEKLKDQLESHRNRLSDIQANALGIASHQSQLIEARRIESIERIWRSVTALAGQKVAAKMMQSVNFDFAANAAPSDPKIREMFSSLNRSFKLTPEVMSPDNADTCRLYVSAETWATLCAYRQVVLFAVLKMKMLEIGYNGSRLIKSDEIMKMVQAVLPHQANFIKDHGLSSLDFLVEEIETKIFDQLRNELHGSTAGREGADRAATILRHVHQTHLDAAAREVGSLGSDAPSSPAA